MSVYVFGVTLVDSVVSSIYRRDHESGERSVADLLVHTTGQIYRCVAVEGPADRRVRNTLGYAGQIHRSVLPRPDGLVVHRGEGRWKFDGQVAVSVGGCDFVRGDALVETVVVAKDVLNRENCDSFAFGVVGNAREDDSVIVRLNSSNVRVVRRVLAESHLRRRPAEGFARDLDALADWHCSVDEFHYLRLADYDHLDQSLSFAGCVVGYTLVLPVVLAIHVSYRQFSGVLVDPKTIGRRQILACYVLHPRVFWRRLAVRLARYRLGSSLYYLRLRNYLFDRRLFEDL